MSWTYSDNDEIFNGSVVDTREDAINELKQEYGSGYVGRVVPIPPFTKNARAEAPAFRHGEEARAPLILKQLNI